jgi:hypothetical protein
MSPLRLLAIVLIFVGVTVAWWVLGFTVQFRTHELDDSLSAEMASLWGPEVLAQASPYWAPAAKGVRTDPGAVGPASSKITADLKHEHRDKGLLWYSTFTVDFSATYTVAAANANEGREPTGEGRFVFPLPRGASTYHDLSVQVDGQPYRIAPSDIPAGRIAMPMARDVEHTVAVQYRTGGQDRWLYCPGDAPAPHGGDRGGAVAGKKLIGLKDLSLTVATDFREIDYPKGTLSPTSRATVTATGMQATWDCPNLITSQCIGIELPRRQNAGPIAARMSYFAPVSLLFFFTVLFAIVALKDVRLHPMHYLFVAAGFFAFHILLAYLADLTNIHAAFWICAGVSVFLVVTYMRLVAGVRFAVIHSGLAQLVYLVGFSYAFFWKGRTGLTVTIGAVITLFVLMQATGRMNWHEFFRRRNGSRLPDGSPTTLPPVPSPPAGPQDPRQAPPEAGGPASGR